ncbi:hypothetical protein TWF506_005434 [Arthrobotrys conoides]|uniref:Uncharacterized protein n=1 Tax=Arthrobotrys conoides TaxID=74498 RepID=A0AAN8NJ90_9PEZI
MTENQKQRRLVARHLLQGNIIQYDTFGTERTANRWPAHPLDQTGFGFEANEAKPMGKDAHTTSSATTTGATNRPTLQRDVSFCSTCSETEDSTEEEGLSPRNAPNLALLSQNSWSPITVEDGLNEEPEGNNAYGATLAEDDTMSDCSCCACAGCHHDVLPDTPRRQRPIAIARDAEATGGEVIRMDDEGHRGDMMSAFMIYVSLSLLFLILRAIPGFFSTFFGWEAWTGTDEIGVEDGLTE